MTTTTKSYVIPLRKSFQEAAPLKRGPKAIRAIKAYLFKHCKVETVKLGAKLNALIWAKGITNPPHKVKVTVVIDNDIAKAELEGFTYIEAKKIEKKKEAETLKEKIASKMGVKDQSANSETTPIKEAEKKPAAKPVEKKADKPAPATNNE